MEYDGGTYISQVESSSPKAAVKNWIKKLSINLIQGLNTKTLRVLADSLKMDSPMPIEGISNTWCISATIRGKLALVTIVQTYEK